MTNNLNDDIYRAVSDVFGNLNYYAYKELESGISTSDNVTLTIELYSSQQLSTNQYEDFFNDVQISIIGD